MTSEGDGQLSDIVAEEVVTEQVAAERATKSHRDAQSPNDVSASLRHINSSPYSLQSISQS